jgi:hypothetical protein
MIENFKEKFLSGRIGQTGFLFFSAYTLLWAIIEPLNLDWINFHKTIWRIILFVFAIIVTVVLSIRLISSILDKIDADGPDRTLQNSYSSTGNPIISVQKYGNLGHVVNIKADFNAGESDWLITSSAQKAAKLELIYKTNKKFDFYLRVAMVSKSDPNVPYVGWIRFDSLIVVPDPYILNTPELGVPYNSIPFNNFNKAVIDIPDAVNKSYGQDGWIYNKIMIFRIRCYDVTLKSVTFKK